jgi:hypothetical protein
MRKVLVSGLCVVLAVLAPITLAWAPNTVSQPNDISMSSVSPSQQLSPFELHASHADSHSHSHRYSSTSDSAVVNDSSHDHLAPSSETNDVHNSAVTLKSGNHDCCAADATGGELMSLSCFMDCSALGFGLVMLNSQQLMRLSQTFVTTEVPTPIDSLPSQRLRPPIY